MVSVWIRASRLRYAGRSQAIPLRNQRRLGRRVKGQLHRLGHAPNLVPNLVDEPLDDPPQLLGVRLLETGRVDGKPGEPAGDLRDHGRCESGRKEHQQHVARIQVISQLSRTLPAYEDQMLNYGFAAVKRSLINARQAGQPIDWLVAHSVRCYASSPRCRRCDVS